jgi:hypothetical protein
MNSTAFLLLANSSSEVDKNQKIELTIGSLSFCVGLSRKRKERLSRKRKEKNSLLTTVRYLSKKTVLNMGTSG